jgi:hypothetical protein
MADGDDVYGLVGFSGHVYCGCSDFDFDFGADGGGEGVWQQFACNLSTCSHT